MHFSLDMSANTRLSSVNSHYIYLIISVMCLIVVILSKKVLLLSMLLYTIIICTSPSSINFFSVSVTRFFHLNFVFYKIFFCFSILLLILEQTAILLYALSSLMFSNLLLKKVIYLSCV